MRLRRNAKSIKAIGMFAVVVACLASATTADAASCAKLKSELSRLEAGSGKASATSGKWQTAQRQQQKAIRSAERDLNYLGCGATASAQCKSLTKKVRKMKSNLAAIERQLAKAGGRAPKSSKRLRQVRAALAKQSCNQPAATRKAKKNNAGSGDKPRSLLARLFAPNANTINASATAGDKQTSKIKRSKSTGRKRLRIPSGGTFRTLCVRTCDGYFFPVSFSTGKNQFANDAARCSEICPASETELYVYKNPGGDASQMMSLAGNVYSDQHFAYRYKTEFVENCSCRQTGKAKNRSAWTEVAGGSGGRNRLYFSDISTGLPRQSIQLSMGKTISENTPTVSPLSLTPLTRDQLPLYEDPDTLANLEKGFNVSANLSLVETVPSREMVANMASNNSSGLPVLSNRRKKETADLDTGLVPPVFKIEDAGFRPAPEREAPVRVVGPEYFVAQ